MPSGTLLRNAHAPGAQPQVGKSKQPPSYRKRGFLFSGFRAEPPWGAFPAPAGTAQLGGYLFAPSSRPKSPRATDTVLGRRQPQVASGRSKATIDFEPSATAGGWVEAPARMRRRGTWSPPSRRAESCCRARHNHQRHRTHPRQREQPTAVAEATLTTAPCSGAMKTPYKLWAFSW